jgi:hypothetical protein
VQTSAHDPAKTAHLMPQLVSRRVLDARIGSWRGRPRTGFGIQCRNSVRARFGKASMLLLRPKIGHHMPQYLHPRAVRRVGLASCVYWMHGGPIWIEGSA